MSNYLYYSRVGSYDGAVKIKGRWIPVKGLNRINKSGWHRVSGPPSEAIVQAMLHIRPVLEAKELFPHLIIPGA